jgi:signal transduction histidine kinase
MRLPTIDLYNQRNLLKIFLGINVALIGIGTLIYTYNIVQNINSRERKLLELYAIMIADQANHVNTDEDYTTRLEFLRTTIQQNGMPFIIVAEGQPIDGINVEIPDKTPYKERQEMLKKALVDIEGEHPPLEIEGFDQLIFYGDSPLLIQMRYYPYVQILSLLVLASLAYLVFSSSRAAEQNRVWVGLAKETAHQLGTPIASLMGWVEFFRTDTDRYPPEHVLEVEKDVQRLEMITTRFSSIGSTPTMKKENVGELIGTFLDYLKKRISTKVKLDYINLLDPDFELVLNRYLFEWVIENLCKNAVDAMNGTGHIAVTMGISAKKELVIDITDTGKGIARNGWKKVFRPGFSTKKRGWGLGLTLAKRIIEEYHKGKLFVKNSETNKGTTFRIVMPITEIS